MQDLTNKTYEPLLNDILVRCKCTSQEVTHVTLRHARGSGGKYNIADEDLENLYIIVDFGCRLVTNDEEYTFDENPRCTHSIAEKPGKCRPYVLDVDFKVVLENESDMTDMDNALNFIEKSTVEQDKDLSDREKCARKCMLFYNIEDVETIIKLVYNVASKFFVFEKFSEEDVFKCAFTIKKPYAIRADNSSEVAVKNGFHLHFPYLYGACADINKFEKEVVFAAEQLFKTNEKLFERYREFYDRDVNAGKAPKVFDTMGMKTWLLYGGIKANGQTPYQVYRTYDYEMATIDWETFISCDIDWANSSVSCVKALSYHYPRNVMLQKRERETQTKKAIQESVIYLGHNLLDVDGIWFILDRLQPSFYESYNDWIRVGLALIRECEDPELALEIFDKFSQKSTAKYDKDVVIKKFKELEAICDYSQPVINEGKTEKEKNDEMIKNFNNSRVRMSTLLNTLTREEIVEYYRKYHPYSSYSAENLNDESMILRRFNMNTLCMSIKQVAPTMAIDVGGKETFIWKGAIELGGTTYWRPDSKGYIKKIICDMFIEPALKTAQKILKRHTEGGKNKGSRIEVALNAFCDALAESKRPAVAGKMEQNFKMYVASPMSESELFNIEQKIFAFRNKILEWTCDDRVIIRNAVCTDYVTKCSGLKYRDLCEDDIEVQLFDRFIRDVLPNKEVREWVIERLAVTLAHQNSHKEVYFWLGQGGNGKSAFAEIINACFGAYYNVASANLFYQQTMTNGEAPQPNRKFLLESRVTVVSEVDTTDSKRKLDTGNLKALSGNDTQRVRNIFEEGSLAQVHTRLIFCVNNLPLMKVDGALHQRLKVVKFETTFVDPSLIKDSSHPNLKPANLNIEKHREKMAMGLMYRLIESLKKTAEYYRENGELPKGIPEKVINDTNDELAVLNVVRTFFQKYYEYREGSKLKYIDIWSVYQTTTYFKNDMTESVFKTTAQFELCQIPTFKAAGVIATNKEVLNLARR